MARRELMSWARTGWAVVFIHAALFGGASLYGGWKGSLVPLYLLAIAVSGMIMHWGQAVFLPLAGFYFGLFWAPSPYGAYAHNAYEAMMEDIFIPVIYAAAGAAVGIFIEVLSRLRGSPGSGPATPPPSSSRNSRAVIGARTTVADCHSAFRSADRGKVRSINRRSFGWSGEFPVFVGVFQAFASFPEMMDGTFLSSTELLYFTDRNLLSPKRHSRFEYDDDNDEQKRRQTHQPRPRRPKRKTAGLGRRRVGSCSCHAASLSGRLKVFDNVDIETFPGTTFNRTRAKFI